MNSNYIQKLNNFNLKALSFTELNNPAEILSFINNCQNRCNRKYSNKKINNIMFNNNYLAYIYYKNDNPLGYLIAYINKNDESVLKIDNIGVLKQYQDKNFELEFVKNILLKSWENKAVDKATITFKSTEIKMKNILEKLNFDKNN